MEPDVRLRREREALRYARVARGWSLDDAADRLVEAAVKRGWSDPQPDSHAVGRWERGERSPRPRSVQLLCDVYQRTPDELGLGLEPQEDDVKRREFLRATLLGGGMVAATGWDGAAALLNGAFGSPSPMEVQNLATVTAQLGSWYWRMSPDTLRPLVAGHLSNLLGRVPRVDGRVGQELRVLAAQTGLVAGQIAYRQDDYGTSRRHLDHAEQLAREAGDGATVACILTAGRQLISSTAAGGGGGRAAIEAIALLNAADKAAGPAAPTIPRVWLLCSRAEEAGSLGHETEALGDLDAATTAFAMVGKPSLGFFDHWDEARLDGWRASTLLQLGRSAEAAETLQRVVSATPPDLPGPRAAVVADLGAARAAAGEPESAAQLLLEALNTARQGGADDGIARVRRIRRNQLGPYGDVGAVKDLDAILEANRELPGQAG
jgi:transcriptional regulator with XRE-family HTH domain